MKQGWQVVLVAADPLWRRGLARLLELLPSVGALDQCGSLDQLSCDPSAQPSLVLASDALFIGPDGSLDTAHFAILPQTRLCLISDERWLGRFDTLDEVFRRVWLPGLRAGAQGVVQQSAELPRYEDALRALALNGGTVFPLLAGLFLEVLERPRRTVGADGVGLSGWERWVLSFVWLGRRPREIAASLQLSEADVMRHVRRALDKLRQPGIDRDDDRGDGSGDRAPQPPGPLPTLSARALLADDSDCP